MKTRIFGVAAFVATAMVTAAAQAGDVSNLNGTFVGSDDGTDEVVVGGTATIDTTLIGPGAALSFTLDSYTTEDTGDFDGPVIVIDGNLFALALDGGDPIPFISGEGIPAGGVDNSSAPFGPQDYTVALGEGVFEVTLGVYTDDGGIGAGTATFSNAAVVPAPGALALMGLAGLVGTRRRRA